MSSQEEQELLIFQEMYIPDEIRQYFLKVPRKNLIKANHHGHCYECLEVNPEAAPLRQCQICLNWDDSAIHTISDLNIKISREYFSHPNEYCRGGIAKMKILQHSSTKFCCRWKEFNVPMAHLRFFLIIEHLTGDFCIRTFTIDNGRQAVLC